MCLIVFAYRKHPDYPLIFAGNRDEQFERPTRGAQFWDKYPDLLAGRDLESGGTWLGITKKGHFSTVTNFRDADLKEKEGPSRGSLVIDYLTGNQSPEDYMRDKMNEAHQYNGFNLLAGNTQDLFYMTNYDNDTRSLSSGIYGLSNHKLDNNWPKVRRAKQMISEMIDVPEPNPEELFELLYDTKKAPDDKLPNTGLPGHLEKKASSIFIDSEPYGTRSSTVVLLRNDGLVYFDERYHEPGERETNRAEFTFYTD